MMATLEDLKMLFAEFPREAVSWRAQSLTKEGDKAMALAYIDARDVMDRLDQAVGATDWQDRYEFHGARTICYLSIRVGDEWITKADGAGDSDVEAEKGAISDALKRAAVKWGIGRYLYDLDAPWVPCESYKRGDKLFWKRWKADPWAHVKNAGPPPKSAMALKRTDKNGQDAWDRLVGDLHNEFLDCKSVAGLAVIRDAYRQRARDERWPTEWLALLKGEFETFAATLSPADDAFPGDVPANGSFVDSFVNGH